MSNTSVGRSFGLMRVGKTAGYPAQHMKRYEEYLTLIQTFMVGWVNHSIQNIFNRLECTVRRQLEAPSVSATSPMQIF